MKTKKEIDPVKREMKPLDNLIATGIIALVISILLTILTFIYAT